MNNRTNRIGAFAFPGKFWEEKREICLSTLVHFGFRLLDVREDADAPDDVLVIGESPKFEEWDYQGDVPEYQLGWTSDGVMTMSRIVHQQSKGVH